MPSESLFLEYKTKQRFLDELASGYITDQNICLIGETGQIYARGKYYPNITKATQTTLGLVMGGNGITIDVDGKINWTGQIPKVTYWVAQMNWGNGNVGEPIAIAKDLLVKATGDATTPTNGDIVVTSDGYQYVVTGTDAIGRAQGIIVTTPPATAVWSNIAGNLSNNQYIPALDSTGAAENILGIDGSDVVQVGTPNKNVNIKSLGTLTNNGEAVVLADDLAGVRTELSDAITAAENQHTTDKTALQNSITAEETARTQADAQLKVIIDGEISDRGTAVTDLEGKIAAIIDDVNLSYSKTFSSEQINKSIVQVYHAIPDVQTVADLPDESTLRTPSICYVISEKTQYLNSKTGFGWHSSGGDFITIQDLLKYLQDNGYIKSSNLINNVTTNDSQKALSAAMGKWLMDNKLSATQVIDNVTTGDTNNPLSANMGKYLNDQKLGKADIINNLTSLEITKPLAAGQGKILLDRIKTLEGYFADGKAKLAKSADTATAANKLSATKRFALNLSGFVTGSGFVDTDWAGNPTLNVVTAGGESASTLQQNATSWYHYSKYNTNACLCRFLAGTQVQVVLTFYDNFNGAYEVAFGCRPEGGRVLSGNILCRMQGRVIFVGTYKNFPSTSKLCVYVLPDNYIYIYMCGTATYHICGFTASLSTEGGGNLELLPMGNNVAVGLPTNAKLTYITNFLLGSLMDGRFPNTISCEQNMRAGYYAPGT